MKKLQIFLNGVSALISTKGAALIGLSVDSFNLIEPNTREGLYAGKILAPWPNRIKDGKYSFNKKASISARLEYFNDPNEIMIRSITSEKVDQLASSGLCFNYKVNSNAMFRAEYRNFLSNKNIYTADNFETNFSNLLITSLSVWF